SARIAEDGVNAFGEKGFEDCLRAGQLPRHRLRGCGGWFGFRSGPGSCCYVAHILYFCMVLRPGPVENQISSVTQPSAAVFTCRAYLNRRPLVAFGAGFFQAAFRSARSASLTLSVMVFFTASSSMVSSSRMNASAPPSLAWCDMTDHEAMGPAAETSVGDEGH